MKALIDHPPNGPRNSHREIWGQHWAESLLNPENDLPGRPSGVAIHNGDDEYVDWSREN